jgi:hypothetical protein
MNNFILCHYILSRVFWVLVFRFVFHFNMWVIADGTIWELNCHGLGLDLVPYLNEAHLEVSLTKHAIGEPWPLYYVFILSTTCKQRRIRPVAFKELWVSVWPDHPMICHIQSVFCDSLCSCCRGSRWPRDLKGRCAAAQLLGSRVRIPLEHGFSSPLFLVCCVGSDLYEKLIALSDARARVCVCGVETATMRWPGPELGCCSTEKIETITTANFDYGF